MRKGRASVMSDKMVLNASVGSTEVLVATGTVAFLGTGTVVLLGTAEVRSKMVVELG